MRALAALALLCCSLVAAAQPLLLTNTPPATTPAPANLPPVYPEAERLAGHEGRVMLDVVVLVDGSAAGVTVFQSSGFPALDQAAQDAVRLWTFQPKRGPDGRPISSVLRLPVDFKLAQSQVAGPQSQLQMMLAQPCASLNADVAAFRALTPDRPLGDMPVFKTSGDLVFAAASRKSAETQARVLRNLPLLYEQVAQDCARWPDANYEGVLAEATRRVMKQGFPATALPR